MVEDYSNYQDPIILGGIVAVIFNSLMDKVIKRIERWKLNIFYLTGREILLKIVVQTIPIYEMNIFKLLSSCITN